MIGFALAALWLVDKTADALLWLSNVLRCFGAGHRWRVVTSDYRFCKTCDKEDALKPGGKK